MAASGHGPRFTGVAAELIYPVLVVPQHSMPTNGAGMTGNLKGASTGFCVRALPRSPDSQPLANRKDTLFIVDAETHRERCRRSRVAGA